MSIPFTFAAWHPDTVTNLGSVQQKRRLAEVSPYAARIRLGAAIRQLRATTSTSAIADRAGLDRSVVSKIEAADRRSGLDTVLRILDHLPIERNGPEYLTLQQVARDGLEAGWWQDPAFRQMGERQARTADLECGATIQEYPAGMLPGLLQTEAYARYRAEVALRRGVRFDLDATVAGRMRRQVEFFGRDGAEYDVVLEPQAIWRLPVPPAVMREQLLHLHRLAIQATKVRIHLLPVDARLGDGWVPRNPFAVYSYPGSGDLTLVAVDTVGADLVLTDSDGAGEYVQLFKELHGAALSMSGSADLIQQAADAVAAEA
jgi:transcriptional regulator with XRE-family HTH domain